MVNLLIKNKMFSLGGHSTVKDENGQDRYVVKGAVFSLRRKKEIYDMNGNLQYVVKNKLFNLFMKSSYIFDAEGNKIAQLKKKFKMFEREFNVLGFKDEISIQGDIIQHSMDIFRNGEKIGEVGKKFISLVDQFNLISFKDEDAPFLVALIVGLDNINDRNK